MKKTTCPSCGSKLETYSHTTEQDGDPREVHCDPYCPNGCEFEQEDLLPDEGEISSHLVSSFPSPHDS